MPLWHFPLTVKLQKKENLTERHGFHYFKDCVVLHLKTSFLLSWRCLKQWQEIQNIWYLQVNYFCLCMICNKASGHYSAQLWWYQKNLGCCLGKTDSVINFYLKENHKEKLIFRSWLYLGFCYLCILLLYGTEA